MSQSGKTPRAVNSAMTARRTSRHDEEDDRLARRPAERDQTVEDVVVAVLEQRATPAQAVAGDHQAVEQEDAEQDERRRELAPRHRDRIDGERTDREGEADARAGRRGRRTGTPAAR